MAEQSTLATGTTGSETPEAFLADRQRFWNGWTRFVTAAASGIALLLILLYLFLVL